jgi:NitT/TauT family transport system permease protein
MEQDEAVLAEAARRYAQSRAGHWVDHRVARWALPLVTMAVLLGLWDLFVAVSRYPSFILPTPAQVWSRFLVTIADGTLWWHARLTLTEILGGLALGISVATLLGYLVAKSALLDRLLSPYIVASQSVPVVALAPLLVIWFGFGSLSKILVCALTLFFPVLVNTTVGLRSVSRDLRALLQSLGAGRWQTFTMLEVPAALPVLLGGLKIGVTLSVIGAVVGEFVGADRGLGFLLNLARGMFDTPLLFVALAALVAIALLLYAAVSALEGLVLRGRR